MSTYCGSEPKKKSGLPKNTIYGTASLSVRPRGTGRSLKRFVLNLQFLLTADF